MEISRQEHWSGLSFASAGDLPGPGITPSSLVSPALAMDSLQLCHLGSLALLSQDASCSSRQLCIYGRKEKQGSRERKQPSSPVPSISRGKSHLRSSQQTFPSLIESHENPSFKGGWEGKYSVVPASVVRGRQKKDMLLTCWVAAAAAAKLLQSCPTLCDPRDGSPPGFPVPGILQARTLEWVAISFSNGWKWKVKVKSLSRVRL